MRPDDDDPRGRTIYPVDEPCPACKGQMASDGREVWCKACGFRKPFEVKR